MSEYRIIYRDLSLDFHNGKERTEALIKPLYWAQEVENWKFFNGEIEIKDNGTFGAKDAAIITISTDRLTEKNIANTLKKYGRTYKFEIKTENGWEDFICI